MIWSIFFSLIASSYQAHAVSADCSLTDRVFSVENHSLPDKLNRSEIRQHVSIKSSKKETFIVKNGKGGISFISGGDNSVCTGTAAYILDEKTVAILFATVNSPFPDKLMMVVYDAKADRILKKEKDLGIFAKVDAHPEGFVFSKMEPRTEADVRKMKSPLTNREMNATDHDLAAFQIVRMKNKKLVREYDPQISWQRTDWAKFFQNETEYLEAAGWNAKKKTFKNVIVYKASHLNRKESDVEETCIQFVEKRGANLDKKKWRCVKERHARA